LQLDLPRRYNRGALRRLGFAFASLGDEAIAFRFAALHFLAGFRFLDELARDVGIALGHVGAVLDELQRLAFFDRLVRRGQRLAACLELFTGNAARERLARNAIERCARLLETVDSIR
jgi:hypothetical protein